jgi:predicted anti-sigma-YlaC factor YlaD
MIMESPRHMSLSCREVRRHILDELDTQLSGPRFRTHKEHLDHCPDCRAYLSGLKYVIWLYQHYPMPRVSARMRNQVLHAVFADREHHGHAPHASWSRQTTL